MVYLLLAGCVKVVGNEGGREPLLVIRAGGDLVGEMAVLSGRPQPATASTCAATSARAICEIASLAGVKLATAEKALRGLQRAGVVRLGYRSIVFVDLRRSRPAAQVPGS
jgi:CRP-like cAMP-binding protein